MRDRDDMLANRFATLAPILAILYGLGFANLFLRSNFGVLAPELAGELALEPRSLSIVSSVYFFAYAAMQVPTGMLLDRYGPRRTMAGLLFFTAVGTALFALGSSTTTLALARLLMGLGCAGIFTGAFCVLSNWLTTGQVVVHAGALNSFAAFGNLCATTPFAVLIAWIGWRNSYWLFAACVGALLVAVALFLREYPADRPPAEPRGEGLTSAFAGVLDALKQPGVRRLLVIGLPMSSAGVVSGVWGAPYLRDVHALDAIGRGNVLLAMAVCATAGHFLYGQLARLLNTIKGVILTGSFAIIAATSLLAFLERPSLLLVTALFCLLGLCGAYPTLGHAHVRALVPAHLIGRGVSLINMGIMLAAAVMQLAFGWIVGAVAEAAGSAPEHAYRVAFAAQAAVTLLAIVIYVPVRDARPRG
jgi:MFS family permease